MLVTEKSNGKMYHVYDVVYDKAGYPHFLIYKNNQWIRQSAKYFEPNVDFERLMAGIKGADHE